MIVYFALRFCLGVLLILFFDEWFPIGLRLVGLLGLLFGVCFAGRLLVTCWLYCWFCCWAFGYCFRLV